MKTVAILTTLILSWAITLLGAEPSKEPFLHTVAPVFSQYHHAIRLAKRAHELKPNQPWFDDQLAEATGYVCSFFMVNTNITPNETLDGELYDFIIGFMEDVDPLTSTSRARRQIVPLVDFLTTAGRQRLLGELQQNWDGVEWLSAKLFQSLSHEGAAANKARITKPATQAK